MGNLGARKGAQIIYPCDPDKIVALFICAKSDIDRVTPKEILDALTAPVLT